MLAVFDWKAASLFHLMSVTTVTHKGHAANKNTATKQKHLLQIKEKLSYPSVHLIAAILAGDYKQPRAFPPSSRYAICHLTCWENHNFYWTSFLDAKLFLWDPRTIQTNRHWSISNTGLKQGATVRGNWPSSPVGDSFKVFRFSLMCSILFFISFRSSFVLSVRKKNTLRKIRLPSTLFMDEKLKLYQLK